MKVDDLRIRREERDALLRRAVDLLTADARIVAAWLHGSMGRGTHDDWSDIDLWVVVADEHCEAVFAEREEFIARLDTPLLTIEAPQNAPPGGAYLLAMYPGSDGPHIVDCSWQPQSSAGMPADVRLLFDRVGIPSTDPVPPEPEASRLKTAVKQTAFFWMMATVVAKYIARRRAWDVLTLLSFLSSVVEQVKWLAGKLPSPPTYRDQPAFPPPITAIEQMAALRGLMEEMEGLVGEMSELSEAVSRATVEQVHLMVRNVEVYLARQSSA